MIAVEPLAGMETQVGGGHVVFGGGIAGLTIARELLKQGCHVTVVEKGATVGGLARTFERDGFRFDIGGHRFHSNNPSVVQWLKDLLGADLLTVPRFSHIYLNQQFVDYPIQFPGALTIFSPLKAIQMVSSYLMAKLTERQRRDVSFEDWVIKRYGRALYEVFFQPYTEKVWGIPGDRLSAAWASQRIGIPSMWRAVRHAIFPPQKAPATAISQFYLSP
ncbi:FAD-dependent oxidoreductase [Trichothermofontia sichuanensis B231]|uniref:FAD-dependent oxidoreductase n=1 Tax=Trichothermofontia sichuanensis TaxID=3045816 RepID=UPI0022457D4E|nr:FAD-dependent oxidoreductase [Trichothermofontia sichuanensis]UZQ54636.1 FAD-dependent oxidoreductase [Trichothermofontia sichuanensis B231]